MGQTKLVAEDDLWICILPGKSLQEKARRESTRSSQEESKEDRGREQQMKLSSKILEGKEGFLGAARAGKRHQADVIRGF